MSSEDRLIATRYVAALFDLATQSDAHDTVKADMLMLKSIIKAGDGLDKLLNNPVISRKNAEKSIEKLLTAIKACELTHKFFALLARNRRLAATLLVIDAYLARLAESRGELSVRVTSARALSEDEVRVLSGSIAKSTGKKVEIMTRENPALLGGLQVRIGSRLLDNSVAGKLSRLKQLLTRAA